MATVQLTLNIEAAVVDEAKRYAESQHRELNLLLEEYLKKLAERQRLAMKEDDFLTDNILLIQKQERDVSNKVTENDPLLKKIKTMKASPELEQLTGLLKGKIPADVDYDEVRYQYLKEKYDL